MVRKLVNEEASVKPVGGGAMAGNLPPGEEFHTLTEEGREAGRAGGDRAVEDSRSCPRCKRLTAASSPECSHCGFSFRETSLLSSEDAIKPAGAAPGKGPGTAGKGPGAGAAPREPTFDRQSLVGSIIGNKYRVLEVLGEGGFGVVYKVEFLLFDDHTTFALKVLHPVLSRSENFRRRFLREARLAMSLAHENAIQVREFGQTDAGFLYFTMDFCEGESLKSVLAREAVLSIQRALDITRQILSVVKVAHERGIVHRDLKPENIFLEWSSRGRDRVKVGDFGLAKSIQGRSAERARGEDITRGGIVGSPRYMSPEQAVGDHLDERTDYFSVGMILYEMLHGTVPDKEQLEEGPGGLLAFPDDTSRQMVPRDIFAILQRALAKDRERRFRSADEFLEALDSLPDYTTTYAVARQGRKIRVLRSAAILLLCLAGVVAVLFSPGFPDSWRQSLIARYNSILSEMKAPAESSGDEGIARAAIEEVSPEPGHAPGEAGPVKIESLVPLEDGQVLKYRVYMAGKSPTESDLEFRVVSREEREGEEWFRVEVDPGGHEFYWILNRDENTLSRQFLLPDSLTGELKRVETRLLLRLPRDRWWTSENFETTVGGIEETVTVKPEPGPMFVQGEELFDYLKVVERDPASGNVIVRYYLEGIGEVAHQVFEGSSEDPSTGLFPHRRLLYSRILISR